MLATLSRWRSWVQIPSGTLAARYANWQSDEVQTFVILWVRLPPALLNYRAVFPKFVCKTAVEKRWGGRREVRFLHCPLETGSVRTPYSGILNTRSFCPADEPMAARWRPSSEMANALMFAKLTSKSLTLDSLLQFHCATTLSHPTNR